MAVVTNNIFTQGLTGTIGGDMVFRTLRGKTVVSMRPPEEGVREASEQQRATRLNFKRATVYAKAAMLDPQRKSYYQRRARKLKLPNAYTAAITDYMRKPKLERVDTKRYKGRPGDAVVVSIMKRGFSIVSVEVTFHDAEGEVIEGGAAIRQVDTRWRYVATEAVGLLSDVTLSVKATDTAGQVTRWVVGV